MASKKKNIDEEQVKQWIERGVKKLENMECTEKKGIKKHYSTGAAGSIWCLGFVGALIYFLQQATSVGMAVVGILKALAWPAFLIYNLLEFLKV